MDFLVLHPQPGDYETAAKSNALSCVLRISALAGDSGRPAQVALLAGDIERPQEATLVSGGRPIKADVLLVPHHGSKTSSSAEFLDAVAPRYALVQAGYRNRFRHPAQAPMERYRERHITVVDSPHCGAVTWRSGEPDQIRCQCSQGLRYWHHVVP